MNTDTDTVTQPYLAQPNGELTFEPTAVTRLDGDMDWKSSADTTLTGQSIVNNNGASPMELTMEGRMTVSEFQSLRDLMEVTEQVEVVSNTISIQTSFDKLSWGLAAENNTPPFTFQLKTKQNEENGLVNFLK